MRTVQRRAAWGGQGLLGQAGFTLVELVLVLVLLAVLSAVAIPRLSGADTFKALAFSEQVRATMRLAQKTAVSHRRLVCASFTASSVTLNIATGFPATACDINLPPPTDGTAYATSGSATLSPVTALYFQPSGLVTSDAAGSSTVNPAVLTISNARSVTIYGDTGYVD
jgi:MSHA pilin protein MshC